MATDFRDLHQELAYRIQELVEDIYEAQKMIAEIKRETDLDNKRVELKEILKQLPQDTKGHHTIIVNRLSTKVFPRKGSIKPDLVKAKQLLHGSTYNAIFKRGAPTWVLDSVEVDK